eukprot:1159258-Pelagomonas_calceolata.AAC.12
MPFKQQRRQLALTSQSSKGPFLSYLKLCQLKCGSPSEELGINQFYGCLRTAVLVGEGEV